MGIGDMADLPIAKKSLGQHWLSDQAALANICATAELSQGDTVLEIGPGTGTLTRLLLQHAGHVIAVEKDKQLAADLVSIHDNRRLYVHEGDILKFDLTTLPPLYKVVANIPYYLTSNLLRILSESSNPPKMCVLLMQKEVAARLTAKAGSMSILAITTQFYWQTSLGSVVPARFFTPPPKVDSQILVLKRREKPPLDVDTKQLFRLIKIGFASRRKTLTNTLSIGLKTGKAETAALLKAAGIDSKTRPQELSIENWGKIYEKALPLLS